MYSANEPTCELYICSLQNCYLYECAFSLFIRTIRRRFASGLARLAQTTNCVCSHVFAHRVTVTSLPAMTRPFSSGRQRRRVSRPVLPNQPEMHTLLLLYVHACTWCLIYTISQTRTRVTATAMTAGPRS